MECSYGLCIICRPIQHPTLVTLVDRKSRSARSERHSILYTILPAMKNICVFVVVYSQPQNIFILCMNRNKTAAYKNIVLHARSLFAFGSMMFLLTTLYIAAKNNYNTNKLRFQLHEHTIAHKCYILTAMSDGNYYMTSNAKNAKIPHIIFWLSLTSLWVLTGHDDNVFIQDEYMPLELHSIIRCFTNGWSCQEFANISHPDVCTIKQLL